MFDAIALGAMGAKQQNNYIKQNMTQSVMVKPTIPHMTDWNLIQAKGAGLFVWYQWRSTRSYLEYAPVKEFITW